METCPLLVPTAASKQACSMECTTITFLKDLGTKQSNSAEVTFFSTSALRQCKCEKVRSFLIFGCIT